VKRLIELSEVLDRQSTEWPTGGDTCFDVAELIEALQTQLAELRLWMISNQWRNGGFGKSTFKIGKPKKSA